MKVRTQFSANLGFERDGALSITRDAPINWPVASIECNESIGTLTMRNAWRQKHWMFRHEQNVVDEEWSIKGRIRVGVPAPEMGAVVSIECLNRVAIRRVEHTVCLLRRF